MLYRVPKIRSGGGAFQSGKGASGGEGQAPFRVNGAKRRECRIKKSEDRMEKEEGIPIVDTKAGQGQARFIILSPVFCLLYS